MVRSEIEDVFFNPETNERVREGLPEVLVTLIEYSTHLGDGLTLIVLGALLYWFGADRRRDRRALVMAIGVGALAISTGIKGIVALERPAVALEFAQSDYPGYSFPSAHALGAAAVYGALAAVADTGKPLYRYVLAGVVIGIVALSRVVLGVHYLGDVLAGVVIGLVFVWLVLRSSRPEPTFVFVLSGAIAALAWLLGSTEFTTMAIGAAIGGAATWWYVGHQSWRPYAASIIFLAYLVVPLYFVVRAISFLWGVHWGVEVVGYAVATAAVMLVPLLAERMNDWPPVEWLQEKLPTRGRIIVIERPITETDGTQDASGP